MDNFFFITLLLYYYYYSKCLLSSSGFSHIGAETQILHLFAFWDENVDMRFHYLFLKNTSQDISQSVIKIMFNKCLLMSK